MLFDTLIFKTILKAREIAPRTPNGAIRINHATHWLLDKCFFTNQLLIIRRLTDYGKDTISLRRLLKSMRNHRSMLTRKNYFSLHADYHYDYSVAKKRCEEYESSMKLGDVYFIPEDLDWQRSEEMHRDFDILSGRTFSSRSPDDIIADSIFAQLHERLNSCTPLRNHVDHFIAHTLNREKISKLDNDAVQITFDQLWKAQEIIGSVTRFVGIYLLNRVDHGLLPMPHLSFLEHIELPLVEKDQVSELFGVEDTFRNETNKWLIDLKTVI